jgi:hypothetical protein
MKRLILLLMLIPAIALASPADNLAGLGKQYIDQRAKFFPVWATSIGIHDYDSCLTDYSSESIYQYRNAIGEISSKLQNIDTSLLTADELIDYKLLRSNIEYDNFILVKYPLHEHSPALFVDEALNSLYYIKIDNSMSPHQKDYFLMIRLRRFPIYFRDAGEILGDCPQIYYETAVETASQGLKLIDDIIQEMIKTYPDSVGILSQTKTLATEALSTFKMTCESGLGYAKGTPSIGKQNFNYLLKNIHFLNIDSDSLKKIGQSWYKISNAAMDSLTKIIEAGPPEKDSAIIAPDTFKVADVMAYYQW